MARPQVWQHLKVYVLGVCAKNSIEVVSPFLSCQPSCSEVRINPALPIRLGTLGNGPNLETMVVVDGCDLKYNIGSDLHMNG